MDMNRPDRPRGRSQGDAARDAARHGRRHAAMTRLLECNYWNAVPATHFLGHIPCEATDETMISSLIAWTRHV